MIFCIHEKASKMCSPLLFMDGKNPTTMMNRVKYYCNDTTTQCLHSNMLWVCLRRGIQGLSTQILPTCSISIIYLEIILSYSSHPPRTSLFDGALPCDEKKNDCQLECYNWSCGDSRGRETSAISLEKHRGCWSCDWLDLGVDIDYGRVSNFLAYGDCTD